MSGIAAVCNFDGSAVPHFEIERMANVLKACGPDQQETLMRGNAGFVFCLHSLTPEDCFECQPLLFANRFVTLFDGRIDNRSELGEALGIATSELESMPDSLLVLRLFERWGERGFERILGVFAIIIMDLQAGQLLCVRDQLGLRVLHYYYSGKRFAIATVPEALFALTWVPRTVNEDKVGDTLVRRGMNGESTYYRDIYRLLPGSIIRVRDANFSKSRFWNPEDIADVRFKNDQDYVEVFQERLEAAVKVRLRSNRTPCATITGGLDSSSISVIAADVLAANGDRLNTFTGVPEAGFAMEDRSGLYFDETPYVLRIAQANANIVPHFVPPNNTPIVAQIAQQVSVGGFSPCIFNGLWVMDVIAEARSKGHDVILGGDMGNLTMSYHGRIWLTELLLRGQLLRLFGEIRASHRWRARISEHIILPFVPPALYRRYKKWRRMGNSPWHDFSAIHPAFAERSGVVERAAQEFAPFDGLPPRNGKLGRIRDLDCYCEAADWFAQVRARFGVDFRTPAFDRRLVEFCLGIPGDQYLREGRERWLIRRAMKGRLPDVVLDNKKRGEQAADWYPRLTRERNQIREEMKRLGANANVASIIDVQRLIATLDCWPDRQPAGFSPQQQFLLAIPEALGAAYFIDSATK